MSTLPHSSEIPRCESIEDVIQNFGDLNQLAAEMDSLRELAISVEGRRNELISEHPDQWVAVSNEGVVAAARTRRELFELLEEQRIRPDDVYHDYLNTNPGYICCDFTGGSMIRAGIRLHRRYSDTLEDRNYSLLLALA